MYKKTKDFSPQFPFSVPKLSFGRNLQLRSPLQNCCSWIFEMELQTEIRKRGLFSCQFSLRIVKIKISHFLAFFAIQLVNSLIFFQTLRNIVGIIFIFFWKASVCILLPIKLSDYFVFSISFINQSSAQSLHQTHRVWFPHFVREQVAKGNIVVQPISSKDQLAKMYSRRL